MMSRRLELGHFVPQPGITLIEASAGTGKTYNITHLICKLIASGRCRIDQVLVLTFTEKATQELRDRTRATLQLQLETHTAEGNAAEIRCLSEALDQFDNAAIFTIHGFCNRMLREFSVEAGLGSEFAILKDDRAFKDQLEIAAAREIQACAAQNPWIAVGMNALGLKASFFRNAISLKETEDLARLTQQASPSELDSWFCSDFPQLQSAWFRDRSQLRRELLSSDTPVKKVRKCYKPAQLELAFACFDRVFSGAVAPLSFLSDLLPFSHSNLTGQLRKGQSLKPCAFYDAVDAIPEQLERLAQALVTRLLQLRRQQIEQLVFEQQTLRFDELLSYAREIVCAPGGRFAERLFDTYHFAFVDEFQDTDPVQFAILKRIFLEAPASAEARPLILIGDPKQAIYSFRGGDIFTYGAAKAQARECYYLDTNWRSSPAINDGVNELLQSRADPFHYAWIDYQPVASADRNREHSLLRWPEPHGPSTRIRGIRWVETEPDAGPATSLKRTAADIRELLDVPHFVRTAKGLQPLRPDAIAVLVPDNRTGARMHEELGRLGIPSTLFGGASVFQSPEAQQIWTILEALHHVRDFQRIRAALSASCFHPDRIRTAMDDGSEVWADTLHAFATASQLWQNRGLGPALSALDQHFQWKLQLSRSPSPQRALTNHSHLRHMLLARESEAGDGPHRLLKWMKAQLNDPDRTDQDQLLQLDSDHDAVTILTMHKSKGLEFPIVFLPVLPRGTPRRSAFPRQYHDPRTQKLRTSLTQFGASDTELQSYETEVFAEALRTLYVAMTRAEVLCTMYLKNDALPQSILAHWLPEGASLADRISQLQHQAVHEPASASEEHQLQAFLQCQDPVVNPELRRSESAPVAPAPLAHLSFTGIVHGTLDRDAPEYDEPPLLNLYPSSPLRRPVSEWTIADFDRGTQAGLMFHDLLEHLAFHDASDWAALLESCLGHYGYDVDVWLPILMPWLHTLIHSPVHMPDGRSFRLCDLEPSLCFRETEFSAFTEWGTDTWKELKALFEESSWVKGLPYQLPEGRIERNTQQAFLNGVVDCWCQHDGKYYLIDWKSNALGPTPADYTLTAMAQSMQDHHYHLQYLLYLCALNRYLRWIDPAYRYDRDFGGVAYGYLRGIQPQVSHTGWFTTLPPSDFIDAMERMLPFPETRTQGAIT